VGHDLQHLVLGLAHGDAAHGVAGEVHLDQRLQRFLAQIGVHAALHDAEQGVGVAQALELLLGALGPAAAHLHGLARFGLGGLLAVGLVGRALVELHDDVRIQDRLDLHADLGRHEELVAVDGALEVHASFGDLAHGAQRPDLETARVGQDGLVPLLEAVQTAEGLHDVQARAHPQVEGVAQDDLRAHFFQAARHHALDGAIGAHGHEDGGLDLAVVQGHGATARGWSGRS
jgi:hypothetical protein